MAHVGMIGSNVSGTNSYVFYPNANFSYAISIDGSAGDSGFVTLNYSTELGPGGNLGSDDVQDDILDSWTCAKVRYSTGPTKDLSRVGGFFVSNRNYDFRGILAEVIVFDTFPSSTIETLIDNYLKVKYSDVIPIPTTSGSSSSSSSSSSSPSPGSSSSSTPSPGSSSSSTPSPGSSSNSTPSSGSTSSS